MATVADFTTRFPEFCEAEDSRVQMFLDDAATLMSSPGKWLDVYDVAQQYYAAHFMAAAEATESGDVGALAPTKKQQVDDVIVESAIDNASVSAEDLYSTSYGKRFLGYRNMCLAGPMGV